MILRCAVTGFLTGSAIFCLRRSGARDERGDLECSLLYAVLGFIFICGIQVAVMFL